MKLLRESLKKPSESTDKKIPFRAILIEVISVVLAVLAALAVDDWRETRANAKLAQETLDMIKSDLKSDVTSLQGELKTHQAILKGLLESLDKVKNTGNLRETTFNLNISFDPVVNRAAWQTAIFTQAFRYMNSRLVRDISAIYEMKELYSTQMQSAMNKMLSVNWDNKDLDYIYGQLKIFSQELQMAISYGEELLKLEKRFLPLPHGTPPEPGRE